MITPLIKMSSCGQTFSKLSKMAAINLDEYDEDSIRHLRYSLAKVVQTKNELRKERDALRQQLNAIRNVIIEEPTTDEQNQKVLSYLNLHRLDATLENSHSSDSENVYSNDYVDNLLPPKSISNCSANHMYSKTNKMAFKVENRDPCGKRIGFCSDCNATPHIESHHKMSLNCTPFRNNESRLIADYISRSVGPAIPIQILWLCNEIEKRGLDEEALYRIPGSCDTVNQLYRDLFIRQKKCLPSLSSFEVKVLCSVLKKFLISLKEPLVTRILWRDFVQASEQKNTEDGQRLIKQSISELPTANRDTLAFLMVHLQRIAKSVSTKMDEKYIATVMGPTIVGHSTPNLSYIQSIVETKTQTKVMESILRIPEDYWNSIICAHQSYQSTPIASPNTRSCLGTNVQSGSLSPVADISTISRHRIASSVADNWVTILCDNTTPQNNEEFENNWVYCINGKPQYFKSNRK